MEDSEMKWKTRPMLGAQSIHQGFDTVHIDNYLEYILGRCLRPACVALAGTSAPAWYVIKLAIINQAGNVCCTGSSRHYNVMI
jgi:hypothetical protein